MSLSRAHLPDGSPLALPGAPPYPAEGLRDLMQVPFELPCDDPWLREAGTTAHAYLESAQRAWDEYPEWMDFLALDSPCYDLKMAERDLYLHWWRDAAPEPSDRPLRVLDVGAGIGRFTTAFLDLGADVYAVDGDAESLRRLVWHAAGRPGRLDVHWTSVHRLPDVGEVDVAVASEVLCYVPDVDTALADIVARLRPGGALLISVEARYGWAASTDASPGTVDAALGDDPVLDVPGDRWVRTYSEQDLRGLLERAGLQVERLIPMLYATDGPLERCLPDELSLETLLDVEERARKHPVWGPLNRAWTAVARKPGSAA